MRARMMVSERLWKRMRRGGVTLWVCAAALVFAAGAAATAAPAMSAGDAGDEGVAVVQWFEEPAAARREAIVSGRPLFVYAMMPSCPACIAQGDAFYEREVIASLGNWVCLYLDANAYPEEALKWKVVVTPSFRVGTPWGKVLAERDGGLSARELAEWLRESGSRAARYGQEVSRALSGDGKLSDEQVAGLVELLGSREAQVREAAIGRLAAYGAKGAGAVVEALEEGGLGTRLSAVEILKVWEAPVEGVDPWRPATVEASLGRILEWLELEEFALSLPSGVEMEADFAALAGEDEERAAGAAARLARIGPDLLDEVRERAAAERRDVPRERLMLLRYRLVMPEELARERADLLYALVSRKPAERARAVEAVSRLGGTENEALYLELFQDGDEMVREVALGALRRSAGPAANRTLAELLGDPQPNVRAQVLKELGERPTSNVAGILEEYVKGEEDEDLVGHAVRTLGEIRSVRATNVLAGLSGHPSWQVRASVAEALGERDSYRGRMTPAGQKALKALLGDADTFVVAKAIEGVVDCSFDVITELARAAERLPEMAVKAVSAMGSYEGGRMKAVGYLRKFTKHEDAAVRAEALVALVEATNLNVHDEVEAAFKDEDSQVRQAAAAVVEKLAGEGGNAKVLLDEWGGALLEMLSAEEARERLGAGTALVSLKAKDEALGVLKEVAAGHEELRGEVAEVMRYLEWEDREGLFEYLKGLELSEDAYDTLIGRFADKAPPEAIGYLWREVDSGAGSGSLSVFHNALVRVYFGEDNYYSSQMRSPVEAKKLAKEAGKRLTANDDAVRTLALSLMMVADSKAAGRKAEELFTAEGISEAMRRNALLVLMLSEPAGQVGRAVEALSSEDRQMRGVGMGFLAHGNSGGLYSHALSYGSDTIYLNYIDVEVFKPEGAPKGVTTEMLRSLLSDGDVDVRAGAAYLLAKLGDASGVRTLAAAWREGGGYSYRDELREVIATLGDDRWTPILEEVYNMFDPEDDQYEIKEFYWGIRPMKGPKVLALRKRIRLEVGVNNLR